MIHAPKSSPLQNHLLAFYSVSLIQGHTLANTTMWSTTVQNYFTIVCSLFTDKVIPSPCSFKMEFISNNMFMIYNYKVIPWWHNMITSDNLWMSENVDSLPFDHPTAVILDLIFIGYYTGFQASEWSHMRASQLPKALIMWDFEFFHQGKIPVMSITWCSPIRWLKLHLLGKQKGEKIPFYHDIGNTNVWPPSTTIRNNQKL